MENIVDILREVRKVAHNVSVANNETRAGWRPAAYLSTLADRVERAYSHALAIMAEAWAVDRRDWNERRGEWEPRRNNNGNG